MNGLKFLGCISVFFGIFFLILPLLSTPVIKGLSFWKAVFEIDQMKIEVRAGMWGTCTYYRHYDKLVGRMGEKEREWEEDYEVKCTKIKAGYSFRMSSTIEDAAGELSTTQTLFVLLWSIFAAFLGLIALALALSPNYYQWKHATIIALTSSILAFGIFLACIVIFTGLTRETRLTESAKTIPLYGSLQGDSFFFLSASVLLAIGAGLLWSTYRKEFFKLHRQSIRGEEKRRSLESEITQPLPPSTLGSEGVQRNRSNHWPAESRRGTEISRETSHLSIDDDRIEEDSKDMEMEEIKITPGSSSDADDEFETELQSQSSLSQDNSFSKSSTSYVHSIDGLPPPPPLKSHHANRFIPKKLR